MVCFLNTISIVSASNYYVNPSSVSNISDGTYQNPWKTIDDVNAFAKTFLPGDSVLFKRGENFNGRMYILSSGTASKPIVFTCYGTGKLPSFTHSISDVIYVQAQEYIIIDSLKIIDNTMDPADHSLLAKISYGIVLDYSPHCIVRNCEITLVGIGIAARQGSDFTTITGNNIYNLRTVRNTVGGIDDYGANAMVLGSSDNVVMNNIFRDCWGTSYDFVYDGGAVEFFGSKMNNNRILYNTAINCNGFAEVGGESTGVANNNMVAYNKIINCGVTVTFHNNQNGYYTQTDNFQLYNNVIIDVKNIFTPVLSMFWFADPVNIDRLVLRNNIIWLTTGENVVTKNINTKNIVHTNNIYKLVGGKLGMELEPTEGFFTNEALFTGIAGEAEYWDFRLANGSIAVNYGADIGIDRDFAGKQILGKPDAGVYETQTVPPPETDNKLLLNIYPNPTKNYFTVNTIRYQNAWIPLQLNVYNSSGALMYKSDGISNVQYTFGAEFSPGVYTLVARVNGILQTLQLIKL